MSHSVPPESSSALTAALVQFNQTRPDSLWADAGHDPIAFGNTLDRLFGDAGDIHVTVLADPCVADITTPAIVDDPLVLMTGLSDGLILPLAEHDRIGTLEDAGGVTLHDAPALPEPAALCDFGALVHSILPLADGWYWDLDKAGWVLDHAHA